MKRKIFLLLPLIFVMSCKKHDMTGVLKVNFTFSWNGHNTTVANLNAEDSTGVHIFDSIYSNNFVNLSEIRYFISEISLFNENGSVFITDENIPHYIDFSIPATLLWASSRFIPTGVYDSIIFYFGLLPVDNVDKRFLNQPESDMSWSSIVGGYHFMQINGRWRNSGDPLFKFETFGLHIGGGHAKAVRLSFPQRIYMTEDGVVEKSFDMAVDKWFNLDPVWDFNIYGGSIMQDSVAQRVLMDRAGSVFSIKN
jgi:hypothetical protein